MSEELSMKMRREVAAILSAELIRRGMSRSEYARQLGVNRSEVTKVLGSQENVTLGKAARWLDVLGLDASVVERGAHGG